MHEDDTFLILLFQLQLIDLEYESLQEDAESLLVSHINEQRRLNSSISVETQRLSWTNFTDNVSDEHFRRMFRMPKHAFTHLCSVVESKISSNVFQSKNFFPLFVGHYIVNMIIVIKWQILDASQVRAHSGSEKQ